MTRERTMVDSSTRRSPSALIELLDPEFSEIGASGRLCNRAGKVALLQAEPEQARPGPLAELRDPVVRGVAPGVVLLTYVCVGPDRVVRRSSLWRLTGGT